MNTRSMTCRTCRRFVPTLAVLLAACGGGTFMPDAILPPATPGMVRAVLTPDNEALISWTAPTPNARSAPVTGYRVYQQPPGKQPPRLVHETDTLSYRHGPLSPGNRYVFFVRADSARGLSAPSTSAFVDSPGEPLPPEPPGMVSAELTPDNDALITWTAPTPAANRAPVTAYLVYRQFPGAGEPELLHETDSLSYRHGPLMPGNRYVFFVRANSARGPSPPSASASVDVPGGPLPPEPPGMVSAELTPDNDALITWTAPTPAANRAPVTAYRVYRQLPGAGEPELLHETDSLSYRHGPLMPGNRYVFFVRANSARGPSPPSASASVDVPGGPLPPEPPGMVSAELTPDNDALITWTAPTPAANRAPVTAYRVYRQFPGAGEPELLHETDSLSYRHGPLMPGNRYVFFVRANSARGLSPPSGSAIVDFPSGPLVPLAVPHVTVRADDGPGSMVISWIHARNPEHAIPVTGFSLQYCEVSRSSEDEHYPDTDHCTNPSGWQSAPLPPGTTVRSYRDTFPAGFDCATEARMYRMRALADEPSASSRYSVPTRPVCPGGYSPPRRVDAVFPIGIQELAVRMCWRVPVDNGSRVIGYELQVTPDATLPVTEDGWRIADAHIANPDDAEGNAGAQICRLFTGLARDDERWFRVRAYNLAGHGHWSAPFHYIHEPSPGPVSALAASSVRTPAALAIADARAREGTDPALVFAVTLDRASSESVTVEYATADGTATAGEDYRAESGTLVLAPGETSKAIEVAVLADATDEGEETLTVRLHNADGASIADALATGTIEDDTPIQRAWLTRFGRSVAGQVVAAVGARLEQTRDSHVTVAGMPIGLAGSSPSPEAPGMDGRGTVRDQWIGTPGEVVNVSGKDLLHGSSFHLVSRRDGPAYAAWGRVALERFETDVDGMRMDGEVTTGVAGADVEGDGWLAGVAFSHSDADGAFASGPTMPAGHAESEVETTMTGVYPYARARLNDRIALWGLAGAAQGSLGLDADDRLPVETDVRMSMGAIGVHGTVLSPAQAEGLDLAVRSDAFWSRTVSEAVRAESGAGLAQTRVNASRLRIAVVGARAFALGADRTLTPRVEAGVRHDGGDGKTGNGFEIGAGLRYAGKGVTVEGEVRTLVAHDESDVREWGAGGSVRVGPGASGRGLSLIVVPDFGLAPGGADRLWSPGDVRRLAGDAVAESGRRIEAEVGYGLGLADRPGVLTPYTGVGLSEGGARAWRLGARLRMGPDFALSLGASHREARDQAPERGVGLRGALRW